MYFTSYGLKCTPSWKVCMAPAPCIAVSLFSSGRYKALYRSHHSNYPGCHHGRKIEVFILFYNGNREVFIYRKYHCKPSCLTGCIKTKPLKFDIYTRFSINLTALNASNK